MLVNYHIGRLVLSSLCVGDLVRLVLSGACFAGFSLQNEHHQIRAATKGHFDTLNAELNPICHLLALLGAHHILHVSRIRVNIGPNCFHQAERSRTSHNCVCLSAGFISV